MSELEEKKSEMIELFENCSEQNSVSTKPTYYCDKLVNFKFFSPKEDFVFKKYVLLEYEITVNNLSPDYERSKCPSITPSIGIGTEKGLFKKHDNIFIDDTYMISIMKSQNENSTEFDVLQCFFYNDDFSLIMYELDFPVEEGTTISNARLIFSF